MKMGFAGFMHKIAGGVEEMLFPEIKMFAEILGDEETIEMQVMEKEIYLLCDQALVKVKARVEKESCDAWQKITCTCELLEIDGAALEPTVSESAEILPENIREEAEDLLIRVLKNSGLTTERISPVSQRYAESHKKILRLKKSIMEGGD